MNFAVQPATLVEIERLRDLYRLEMACQIIHDSIHSRAGWTDEYRVLAGDSTIGYGSVAVGGPWKEQPTLYEFFLIHPYRTHIFTCFLALLRACGATRIETQSNDRLMTNMLHAFAANAASESILFEDHTTTAFQLSGIVFRPSGPGDADSVARSQLDVDAKWVLERDGAVVATGDILYHYNRPYGDIYMSVAKTYRRQGLGAFIVQELKRVCYAGGSKPGARCNVNNVASRRTLQRAGFVPCGHILTGEISQPLTAEQLGPTC